MPLKFDMGTPERTPSVWAAFRKNTLIANKLESLRKMVTRNTHNTTPSVTELN